MRKFLRLAKNVKFLVFLFIGLGVLLTSNVVSAEFTNNEVANIYLPAGQVEDNILFLGGANIDVNAQAKDDVYAAGANVVVSGPVAGDVIAAGSNVIINSEINGNLRVAGGNVTINGKVSKNITVFGGMVSLAQTAEVGGNLIIFGGNIEINGKINKNIYGGGGNVVLNSQVLGSAYLTVDPSGNLVLFPNTNIAGNLEYSAGQTADIKPGAKIGQEEKFSAIEKSATFPANMPDLRGLFIIAMFIMFLGTIVVGLVLVYLLKDFTVKTQALAGKDVLLMSLKGLAVLILTPIILVILAATIIGLPLALILGAIYFISLYLSKIVVAIFIGNKIINLIYKKANKQLIWQLIIGLIALFILCAIPFFGWIFRFIATIWGLGVLAILAKNELKLETK